MDIVTAAQMRKIEEDSLKSGLSFSRLMENAGSAAANFIKNTFAPIASRNCVVVCGNGGNAGDGLVVARRLAENGASVVVILLDGIPDNPDAASMFEHLELMQLPVFDFQKDYPLVSNCIDNADIIVDAICGIGFKGGLKDHHRKAALMINNTIAAVVSLDIPSGIDCDSGLADDSAVTADFTTVFDSLKPAHVFPFSKDLMGVITLLQIGIDSENRRHSPPNITTLATDEIFGLLPNRPINSHKGSFGTVLAICGSKQYRGAAALACLGALRSGVGGVRLAAIPDVCDTVAAHILEPTYIPLCSNNQGMIDYHSSQAVIKAALTKADCILIGCGLGNGDDTAKLLELVIEHATCPIVIDADGINALAMNIHLLEKANVPIVLTPHPGEMSRLLGLSVAEVEKNRLGCGYDFASRHNCVVVLKGSGTIVADCENDIYINTTGNSALSKGGSGDLLSGMIASFLAQGLSSYNAAVCAVHLHGLAADKLALEKSNRCVLPSDIAKALCDIFPKG